MVQCAALNCVNNSSSGQKISFFSFPKDNKRRSVWETKLKRKGFKATQHTRLCQVHFEPECFSIDPRLSQSIGFEPKGLRLKPNAVPTLFDYSDPTARKRTGITPTSRSRPKSRSRALQKRSRLEILAEIAAEFNLMESLDQTKVVLQSQCGLSNEAKSPTKVSNHKGQVHMKSQAENCAHQDVPLERFSVSTQTSYTLVERCHAKLKAKCDVSRTKTSIFGVQVA